MISIEYWCRYHGRSENTEDEEACLTTEQVMAQRERYIARRNDPPCLWARIWGWFGVKVQP